MGLRFHYVPPEAPAPAVSRFAAYEGAALLWIAGSDPLTLYGNILEDAAAGVLSTTHLSTTHHWDVT